MVNQLLLFSEPLAYGGGQIERETFSKFLKNYLKNKGRKNVVDVRAKAAEGDEDLYAKIHSHIKRYDSSYSVEDIISEISSNDLVAELFAADPSRQKPGASSILKFLSRKGFEFDKGDLDELGWEGKKTEHYVNIDDNSSILIPIYCSGEGGGQTKKITEVVPGLARFVSNTYPGYNFKFVLEGDRYSRMNGAERISLINNHAYNNVEYLSADEYNG